MARRQRPGRNWWPHPSWHRPSWWIVAVAGTLCLVFLVGVVRELTRGHQVSRQVGSLQQSVATEQKKQAQLQDLIDYLSSPTYQEREARLKLGLKKSGERVIVVEPSNIDSINSEKITGQLSNRPTETSSSNPRRWWNYFFSKKLST